MTSGCGGIGRRAGFKIPFLWSVGSIPTTRTIKKFDLSDRNGLTQGNSGTIQIAESYFIPLDVT